LTIKQKVTGWLQLLRIPNLFTVPGDVVLGFIIGGGVLSESSFPLSLCVVIFLYSFGLISNDLADFNEDSLKRPHRPLPSGKISRKAAKFAALVLLALSLFISAHLNIYAFYSALVLAAFILLYNLLFKKHSILGPFTIALCRMLSVIFGFLTVSEDQLIPPMLYIVCFTWLLYFFAVSLAAYFETNPKKTVRGRFMLFLIPVLWIATAPIGSGALQVVILMKETNPSILLAIASTFIFCFFVLKNFIILSLDDKTSGKISKSIGELISNIIFLQAAGCAFLGFPYVALIIFLLSIPARLSAKKFYAS
jgi:4-hydroxybenzoate polyprenyltransferase